MEVLGQATEVIVSKSNILTTEDMKVERFYLLGDNRHNTRKNSLANCISDEAERAMMKEGNQLRKEDWIKLSQNTK